MLNRRGSDFTALVWAAAARIGSNAPRIADDILRAAFPRTVAEAEHEGAIKPLRNGVVNEIKRILRHTPGGCGQGDFADIEPQFAGIASKLKSNSYFVESLDEYVSVPNLIADPDLLKDAMGHMRRKGMECLAEAKTLGELYAAVTAHRTASPEKEGGE